MSDNVIWHDDDTLGFYDDLKKMLKKQGRDFIEREEYESAQDACELLIELEAYKNYDGILLMTENNGMGWTISKYNPSK